MDKTEEIKQLVEKLNIYRNKYYNENISEITDREYDELFDKLESLERETGFIMANSPTQSVGYKTISKFEKVEHNHPMLSLGKEHDIVKFFENFGEHEIVVMAKLDGLTCSLLYENGELIRAESRGDGIIGEDITHNAKTFKNLPLKIPFKGRLIVDGECIIRSCDFKELVKGTDYKHVRNLASGSIRQLDSSVCAKRNIHFVAWKLVEAEDSESTNFKNGLKFLKSLGFDVVPYKSFSKNYTDEDYKKDVYTAIKDAVLHEVYKNYYPIDGLVATYNDVKYGKSLGSTAHHPKHSLALKFYDEEEVTVLRDIEWTPSRTWRINPVAVFDSVEIDGTTITRASLSNVSVIKELELGIGDRICVVKANQVIPKITKNLTRSNTYKIPFHCPDCHHYTDIESENGREFLICRNPCCKGIILDSLVNFVSKPAMNIVNLSEDRLKIMLDKGFLKGNEAVDYYISLYQLPEKRERLEKIDGFGKRSVDIIVNSIEKSKKCKLENFIVAIGIPSVGKSMAKILAKESDYDVKKFMDLCDSNNDWAKIDGIGESIEYCINFFVKKHYLTLQKLIKLLDFEKPNVKDSEKTLDFRFCITGSFSDSRENLIKKLEEKGATYVSGVSKKLDVLFVGEKAGSKKKKAEDLGVKIADENELMELIN